MSEGHLPMGSLGRWKGENPYIRTYEALALRDRWGWEEGGGVSRWRGLALHDYVSIVFELWRFEKATSVGLAGFKGAVIA